MLFSAISSQVTAAFAILASTCQFAWADDFKNSCVNLTQNLHLENATLKLVEYISGASTLLFPDNVLDIDT
ncbi:hypothetical protein ACQKWADRAFT_299297 [Trichoderma austrokoningii]